MGGSDAVCSLTPSDPDHHQRTSGALQNVTFDCSMQHTIGLVQFIAGKWLGTDSMVCVLALASVRRCTELKWGGSERERGDVSNGLAPSSATSSANEISKSLVQSVIWYRTTKSYYCNSKRLFLLVVKRLRSELLSLDLLRICCTNNISLSIL